MQKYLPKVFDIPFLPKHTASDNQELRNRLFYLSINNSFIVFWSTFNLDIMISSDFVSLR